MSEKPSPSLTDGEGEHYPSVPTSWDSFLPNVPSLDGYGDVSFTPDDLEESEHPEHSRSRIEQEMIDLLPELIPKKQ